MDLACDVCGAIAWKPVYRKKTIHPLWWRDDVSVDMDLNYVVCQQCGYITLSARPSRRDYEIYYRAVEPPSRDAFVARRRMYELRRALILEYIDDGQYEAVLEVGAAYGDFLLLLPEFPRRVGIEPSERCCEFVRESKLPLEYHCCALEDVADKSPELLGAGSLVVAANVLEHALEPRKFVRRLADLARAGGYVYIELPSVEAMAECKAPVYQTVHFGHVSHFATETLNRLCISERLDPVRVVVAGEAEYPVTRALYRKAREAYVNAGLFRQHCESLDRGALVAKTALVKHLKRASGPLVIWGCGEDLVDILRLFDGTELGLLSAQARLVDASSRKQQKKLAGMEIGDPRSVPGEPVPMVVIASRSELIRRDIARNASELFPNAEIVSLYE